MNRIKMNLIDRPLGYISLFIDAYGSEKCIALSNLIYDYLRRKYNISSNYFIYVNGKFIEIFEPQRIKIGANTYDQI